MDSRRKILALGGARSGKSGFAERLARQSGLARIYVATGQAWDAEMAERIARHREDRGDGWETVEAPLAVAEVIAREAAPERVVLVDCLTLWLSNLMADGDDPDPQVRRLCAVLGAQQSPVVLVTNELGLGIVPENALARRFRDEHGWMNQAVAGVADEVWMAVSGLPLRLKPQRGTS